MLSGKLSGIDCLAALGKILGSPVFRALGDAPPFEWELVEP